MNNIKHVYLKTQNNKTITVIDRCMLTINDTLFALAISKSGTALHEASLLFDFILKSIFLPYTAKNLGKGAGAKWRFLLAKNLPNVFVAIKIAERYKNTA